MEGDTLKVGVLTINDNNNYGNRLQNYAVCKIVSKLGHTCETINNFSGDSSRNYKQNIKYLIKKLSPIKKHNYSYKRYKNFISFNDNIKFSKYIIKNYNVPKNLNELYDYFITGSDQVWNPNFTRLSKVDLLSFASPTKRISFSASFGISKLPSKYIEIVKKELTKFKAISTREESGRKIIEKATKRKDIEVLIDPTLLLSNDEWDEIAKKPSMLKTNKFILVYFLGALSQDKMDEINDIAEKNEYKVINILDINSEYYACGPSEFLYLEKNASLICTDSFHSCVFSMLYNTPFIVYEREDSNEFNMNTRIENFLAKFHLEDRKYNSTNIEKLLKCNYGIAHNVLEKEKEKSLCFLKNNLK